MTAAASLDIEGKTLRWTGSRIDTSFSAFIETQEGDGNIFGTVRAFTTSSPVTAVPEPASLVLFGSGLTLFAARRRRWR